MNLVLDLGNTHAKLAVFDKNKLIRRFEPENFSENDLKKISKEFKAITRVLLCSVVDVPSAILAFLQSKYEVLVFNPSTKVPVINMYHSRETLGADRMAAAVAGAYLFPKKNILMIDAGTCIKYNLINSKNEFLGGAISPGLRIRFRALNNFTAKLPLVGIQNKAALIGRNTEESILSGVINGSLEEVRGIVQQYRRKYKNLKVIVTGGDASYFEGKLKISTFASPDLILIGLNVILEHNAPQ